MDNSSLLLPIVGVLGTLAGSGLTGFISLRTERVKAAETERQQIRQEQASDRTHLRELKIEHSRWRRDRRQSAYVDFYAKIQEAIYLFSAVNAKIGSQNEGGEGADQLMTEVQECTQQLLRSAAVVNIEGPREVSLLATQLSTRIIMITASAVQALKFPESEEVGDYRGQFRENVAALSEAQGKFLGLAHDALDEIASLD